MYWKEGEPKIPGWFVLEFSGGDRFVVVHAFYDGDFIFRMEDANTGAYVHDVVDIIINHYPIPWPGTKKLSCT